MPSIGLNLPEGYELISRPVAQGIAQRVISHLGIQDKVSILFPGDAEVAAQAGSTLGEQKEGGPNTRFASTQRLQVSMNEQVLEGEVLATPTWQINHPPIFSDPKLGITMKPIYHLVEGVLSFTYRAADQTSAEQWKNRLLRYISQNRAEMYHEIIYAYALPGQFITILAEIHKLRETVAPYGDTVIDYLRNHFSDRVDVKTNMAGKGSIFAVDEIQKGVIGWFDWTIPPTPEKTSEESTYTATFEFHYQYQQVTGVHLKYPIIVHQQLLPSNLRPLNLSYELNRSLPTYMSLAKQEYQAVKKETDGYYATQEGIRYPDFDEWAPDHVIANQIPVLTVMLTISADDPRFLLNIKELSHWNFNPDILEFMLAEPKWVTLTKFTPVLITLYCDGDKCDDQIVQMDSSGDVRTTIDLDLRRQYHVVISAMSDLSQLNKNNTDLLRQYPKAAMVVLYALEPRLESWGKLPEVLGDKLVSRVGWLEAINVIKTTSPIFRTAKYYARFTVGSYILATTEKK